MILVDANLLLYAYDAASPHHGRAKTWWEDRLSGQTPVWLCWSTVLAFLRIATNPRLLREPLSVDSALSIVDDWFSRPNVELVGPGPGHWLHLKRMIREGRARGPLVTDAALAALAAELGARLCSTDRDFLRFPGLSYENPLEGS